METANLAAAQSRPASAAAVRPEALSDGVATQFITFTIGAEEYGVDIMAVREIKGWTETTSIPNAPAHVRGVINLRGVIVPIFDLRARFGMGVTQTGKTHVVIIVSVGARVLGLLVDTVSDILTVTPEQIRPVPELDGKSENDVLAGLIALDSRMVTLISLAGLFQADTQASLEAASATIN